MPAADDTSLPIDLVEELRARLPQAAQRSLTAIVAEVPAYRGALSGRRAARIASAVELALAGFIDTAGAGRSAGRRQVLDGAYELGRDEARSGRSMEALLAAYRVGARVAWQELADVAARQADAPLIARFAAMVFAYIDELSAASVTGHSDELTDVEIERRRRLERLAHRLLVGDPLDALEEAAAKAAWPPPRTLTALLVEKEAVHSVRHIVPENTLQASDESIETLIATDYALLLVPNAARARLLRQLLGRTAVLGPTRPWVRVDSSAARAVSAVPLVRPGDVLDTEQELVALVVGADGEAQTDLVRNTFRALDAVRPGTRERLLQTLRSWLLHQGRRDAVAADLFVHPQTVRYRMGQLRELLGERLDDPRWCEAAIVALAGPRPDQEIVKVSP